MSIDRGGMDNLLSLLGPHWSDPTLGRQNERPLDYPRTSLFVEQRNQPLTHTQFQNDLLDFQVRIRAKRLCRGFHSFLVLGRECAQGVLHSVSKLAQNALRNI